MADVAFIGAGISGFGRRLVRDIISLSRKSFNYLMILWVNWLSTIAYLQKYFSQLAGNLIWAVRTMLSSVALWKGCARNAWYRSRHVLSKFGNVELHSINSEDLYPRLYVPYIMSHVLDKLNQRHLKLQQSNEYAATIIHAIEIHQPTPMVTCAIQRWSLTCRIDVRRKYHV